MEEKKVVKLQEKESWHLAHVCPHCGSRNTTVNQRPVEKKTTHIEDGFYPGDREVYHEMADCKCNRCLKEYIVDYGESTYDVYDKSILMFNSETGKIFCFAKYRSKMHYDFGFYATENPNNKSELIYFMRYEKDKLPIFITKSEMEEILHDYEQAKRFANNEWMTRYR